MSTTQLRSETAIETPKAQTVDMKLEVVVIPVSDIDRAKRFYGDLGWRLDADFVADMRWLPNPYWVPTLRGQTGRSTEVSDYVLAQDGAREFVDRYVEVLSGVAEGYLREGKRFMSIAIGCTGGKHRSVTVTEEVVRRLQGLGIEARAYHRDLGRE